MPGHVEHRDGKWITSWGDREYEHDTKEDAVDQLRALYANEPQAKSALTPSDVHVDKPLGAERHTPEYLQAFRDSADAVLPSWQVKMIHERARPSSGGRAHRRVPVHGPIEETALSKMTPEHLEDMSDEQLTRSWSQLSGWFKLATKKKLDTERYSRCGSFVAQEIKRRGMAISEDDFSKIVVQKSTVGARLELLPPAILLEGAVGLSARNGIPVVCSSVSDDRFDLEGAVDTALIGIGLDLEWTHGDADRPLYDVLLKRSDVQLVDRSGDPDPEVSLGIVHQPACSALEEVRKATSEKQIIWYLVAEPNAPDTYGHQITREEIEDACHSFAASRIIRMEHGLRQGLNSDGMWPAVITGKAIAVQSYTVAQEMTAFYGVRLERPIVEGSWIAAIWYPDPQLWRFLRDSTHGISWAGFARKVTE